MIEIDVEALVCVGVLLIAVVAVIVFWMAAVNKLFKKK